MKLKLIKLTKGNEVKIGGISSQQLSLGDPRLKKKNLEMDLKGSLITINYDDKSVIVPLSNVIFMEPVDPKEA